VRALPGVTRAAITTSLPFGNSFSQSSYTIDGYTPPAGEPQPHGYRMSVSPDYFQALGISVLRGRAFTEQDGADTAGSVIVDRVLAERYWPGQDPIGRRILGGDGPGEKPWTIVGVVATVKNQSLETTMKKETLYYPLAQAPESTAVLVLKTNVEPSSLITPLRTALAAIDPEQPLSDIKTLNARIDDSLVARRAPMLLLSLFSGIALLLAALGVYGVLAFSVAQRASEFGIRVALGATPGEVMAIALKSGIRQALTGLGIGIIAALLLTRVLRTLLHGVSATDPLTFGAVVAVTGVVAVLASALPAWRAARIDPAQALRRDTVD